MVSDTHKNDSTFTGLVIWNENTYTNNIWRMNSLLCCGYHTAGGKLLMCERELGNIVGTYCGSEDERLSDTKKVVTHFP